MYSTWGSWTCLKSNNPIKSAQNATLSSYHSVQPLFWSNRTVIANFNDCLWNSFVKERLLLNCVFFLPLSSPPLDFWHYSVMELGSLTFNSSNLLPFPPFVWVLSLSLVSLVMNSRVDARLYFCRSKYGVYIQLYGRACPICITDDRIHYGEILINPSELR